MQSKIKKLFSIGLFIFVVFLLAAPDAAKAQGYGSYEECVIQAGKEFCDANPQSYVSGRDNNGGAGNVGSGQCISDDLCKAPDFCRINGVCVPKPKDQQGIGGLIGASSVFEVVAIVLRWLLTLAGVIATVFIIIGGYQYITAAGNEELSEKGKKTLVNAIIGVVIVVLSIAIVTIVTNTLGSTEPLGYKLDQMTKG